jgi:hypothetical protein
MLDGTARAVWVCRHLKWQGGEIISAPSLLFGRRINGQDDGTTP